MKGFGLALCSTTKRLIAACKSTTDRKTPRFNRRFVSLAKKPSPDLASPDLDASGFFSDPLALSSPFFALPLSLAASPDAAGALPPAHRYPALAAADSQLAV